MANNYGVYRSRDENGKLVVKRYDAKGNDKDAESQSEPQPQAKTETKKS